MGFDSLSRVPRKRTKIVYSFNRVPQRGNSLRGHHNYSNPLKKLAVFVLFFMIVSILNGSFFQFTKSMISKSKVPDNVIKDEIIVKYKTNNTQATTLSGADIKNRILSKEKAFDNWDPSGVKNQFAKRSQRATVQTAAVSNLSNVYRLKLRSGSDIQEVLSSYRANPNVEYASYNVIYKTAMTITDPQAGNQWALNQIGLPTALDTTTGSTSSIIAILDTGIRGTHEDLTGKVLAGYNFVSNTAITANSDSDDNGHGTGVAGAAAAYGNNAKGIAGIAWDNKLMPVKVLGASGSGNSFDIIRGIRYAVDQGADIINMSLGGDMGSVFDYADNDVLQYAHDMGVITLVAAGNDAADVASYGPANNPNVITVGATGGAGGGAGGVDTIASFSNYGAKVDVVSPGVNILTTSDLGNTSYEAIAGTSISTPIVSGLAALVLANRPTLTNEQVRQILRKTTTDTGVAGYDYIHGYGRVNADTAVGYSATPSTAYIKAVQTVDNQAINITGTASGASFASYKVEYGVTTMPSSWTQIGSTSSSQVANGTLVSWNPAALSDADYYSLRLTVTNGDSSTSIATMYVNVDHSSPNISLNKISTSINDSTPTFTGVAKVGSSVPSRTIESVQYLLDGASSSSATGVTMTPNGGASQVSYSIAIATPLSEGTHNIIVAAADNFSTWSQNWEGNTFVVDTVAPSAPAITSPADGSGTTTSPITVSGTAEANSIVEVYRNDTSIGTVTTNGSGVWSKSSVALATPGAYAFKAKAIDAAGNTSAFSSTVTINYAVPYFLVGVSDTTVTANDQITVTVTAKDENGATNTGYMGTIIFTSNDSQAVIPADYTFVGGDSGVKVFTNGVRLRTAGTKTITTTQGTMTGSSPNITVSPAAASSLTKVSGDTQEAYVYRTLSNPLIVQAKDVYNNAIPTQALTAAVTAGGGSLSTSPITTGNDGKATVSWTLGSAAGANTMTVSGFSQIVTFTATALAFPNNVTPGNGSNGTGIKSPDEIVSVIFPTSSAGSNGKVDVVKLTSGIPASASGKKIISNVYSLSFEKETGGYLTTFGPSLPTISLNYDSSLATGVNLATAKIYYWDTSTNQWSTTGVTTTSADTVAGKATGTTTHFTDFAVLADATQGGTSILPTAGINGKLVLSVIYALLLTFLTFMFLGTVRTRQVGLRRAGL